MTLQQALPFVTTAILVALTMDILRRYQQHRGTHKHLLIWAIGLGMFATASFSEGVLNFGWNELAVYGWYLFGALLTAAWIGQGTVTLLFRRRWVDLLTIALAIFSVIAVVLLLSVHLQSNKFELGKPVWLQYKDLFGESQTLRNLTIPFNIYGTVALVGGAVWSAYLFLKKQILPNRVLGNVLIAAGALSIALASVVARIGRGEFLPFGELTFALLVYVGFLLASKPARVEERQPSSAAQGVQAE